MTDSEVHRIDDVEIHELKKEVAQLKDAVADLVEAWRAAKGFLVFVKWAATIGSALAIIYSVLHGGSPK